VFLLADQRADVDGLGCRKVKVDLLYRGTRSFSFSCVESHATSPACGSRFAVSSSSHSWSNLVLAVARVSPHVEPTAECG
jgi:hypothetical protein